MNLKSNTAQSIIPIQSGTTRGTAFFVEPGCFMTARHVVVDALLHNHPVRLYYKGNPYTGTALEVKGKDVAIVSCPILAIKMAQEVKDFTPMVAIPTDNLIGEEFLVSGYPDEIGNSIDRVTIRVKAESHVSDKTYDVVTSRVGNYAFGSYEGFSGSPVVNAKGAIVGIAVVEISNHLAFVSIDHIKKVVKKSNLVIKTEFLEFDTSAAGRSVCYDLYEEAVLKAGNRYMPDLHTPNPTYLQIVHDFVTRNAYEIRLRRIKEIEANVLNWSTVRLYDNKIYQKGDYGQLGKAAEFWSLNKSNSTYKEQLASASRILKEYYEKYRLSESNFLYVTGAAGAGKTHLSCSVVKDLLKTHNTYLLFGSMFNNHEDCFTQLLGNLNFDVERLEQLNNSCRSKNENAVVLIDALNEGAGDQYWKTNLGILLKKLEPYEYIKLIVTIREPFDKEILADIQQEKYPSYQIKGYSPYRINDAINKYFKRYDVDIRYGKQFKNEFRNPLFLLVFCVAYKAMSPSEKEQIGYVRLFELYLKEVNKSVSDKIDEDVKRDVTTTLMKSLAEASVTRHFSGPFPRTLAREESDHICPNRLWHQHLLKVLIDEDVLMDTKLHESETDMLMFGYEKMEDFLKADFLNKSQMTNLEIYNLLVHTKKHYDSDPLASRSKFDNMLSALLAIWSRDVALMSEPWFTDSMFTLSIPNALKYEREYNIKLLKKWMNAQKDMMDAYTAISKARIVSEGDLLGWHNSLMTMSIEERDGLWTVGVNKFFASPNHYDLIENEAKSGIADYRLLIVLTWMLTTSYPEAHHFLSKILMDMFVEDNGHINKLLTLFGKANDNYIHHGLLEAIYGVTLLTRESDILKKIGDAVKKTYFSSKGHAKKDLLVRYWGLKIMERIYAITEDTNYTIYPKFDSALCTVPSKPVERSSFGNKPGMLRMYNTLSTESDFYRYVLRSNWDIYNGTFRALDNDGRLTDIAIADIAESIKQIIAKKYRLHEFADNFDAMWKRTDRMMNQTERIGKKYVWLALYEVYAGLCDNCYVKLPSFDNMVENEWTDNCFPWYAGVIANIDPTLRNDIKNHCDIEMHFDVRQMKSANAPILCLRDQYGEEWVSLISFEQRNDANITTHFVANGLFAENNRNGLVDDWARVKDFTGRWLPEPIDNYHCTWNEYPWADAYQRNKGIQNDDKELLPCDMIISYANLLQEETIGVRGEFTTHNTYAPSEQLMDELRLYTAERGICRSKDNGEIVALNRKRIFDDADGLFIKKKALLRYMKRHHLNLYICTLATQTKNMVDISDSTSLPDLSGCWCLNEFGTWKELQPLNSPSK